MRAPEFWNKDGVAAMLLSPLGALYGASVLLKQRRAKPYQPRAQVLCIGNLTAGGSGKTPVAMAMADMLIARGKKVVFLTRGYGGKSGGPLQVDSVRHRAEDVGDEALLLASHAPTIVAQDREKGARLADRLGADIIVMDDGFQNFQIAKDVSLLVIDAQTGFGNGHVIPAGPMRESAARGFARAQAIVLMGEGAFVPPPFAGPVLRAELRPVAPKELPRHRLFAFAGIGRPEKFFAMLRGMGANLAGTRAFPDHHPFTANEMSALKLAAHAARAQLVTTEKDFVRLEPRMRPGVTAVPVQAAFADVPALLAVLDEVTHSGSVAPA